MPDKTAVDDTGTSLNGLLEGGEKPNSAGARVFDDRWHAEPFTQVKNGDAEESQGVADSHFLRVVGRKSTETGGIRGGSKLRRATRPVARPAEGAAWRSDPDS